MIGSETFRKVAVLAGQARIRLRVFQAELYSALVSRLSSRPGFGLSFRLIFSGDYLILTSSDPQHDCPPHRPIAPSAKAKRRQHGPHEGLVYDFA
jgi:hypothetical protein